MLNQLKNHELKLRWRGFRPDPLVIKSILAVGFPSIIMQSISSVMNVLMNLILIAYGNTAVSVLGVYFKLQSFIFMPVHGLNNGMIPVVGYNYGARHRARITGLTRFALCIAVVIMAAGTLLLLCLPGFFLALFNAEPEVLAAGVPALRMIALSFPFAGVSIVLCAVLQAVGESMRSLMVSLTRQILLVLPAALALGLLAPERMWLCFLLSELLSCGLALLLYRQICRQKLSRLS